MSLFPPRGIAETAHLSDKGKISLLQNNSGILIQKNYVDYILRNFPDSWALKT